MACVTGFEGYGVAWGEGGYGRADGVDDAGGFMAHCYRVGGGYGAVDAAVVVEVDLVSLVRGLSGLVELGDIGERGRGTSLPQTPV